VADRRIPAFIHGLPLTEVALAYAEELHRGQRREVDGAPFIVHRLADELDQLGADLSTTARATHAR
jgi:hypothetical protein